LQSLWIIYILFAEKFKAKLNTNIFHLEVYVLHGLSFKQIVPTTNI